MPRGRGFIGWVKRSRAPPTCAILPSAKTATVSPIVSASVSDPVTCRKLTFSRSRIALSLVAHPGAQMGVERTQRLVEEHDPGFGHQRPREGYPLSLSTRDFSDAAMTEIGQAHELERVLRAVADLGLILDPPIFAVAQAEGHVVGNREMRKEREVLEHETDVTAMRRHAVETLAVQQHLPHIWLLITRDQPQERGLAGPGGAKERKVGVIRHGQVQPVESLRHCHTA